MNRYLFQVVSEKMNFVCISVVNAMDIHRTDGELLV